MAHLMYYIIIAAFVLIPALLGIFFLVARYSEDWESFTLDTPVFRRAEAWTGLFVLLVIAAAVWSELT